MTAPPFAERLDEADLSLPERPLVSVVIPTLTEGRNITPLLESLSAQTYGPKNLEILVMAGGGTDRTRELAAAFPSRFLRLKLVDNPDETAVSGLNAGMRKATGQCWMIIDGLSDVEPDFVAQSVAALRRTGAACVGGPIETVGEGLIGSAIAAAMSSSFGIGDTKFRSVFEEEEVDTVPLGCYHRKVWELVGEFDETVGDADGDSYDARLIEAGGRIVLVPEMRSRYHPRQTLEALAKQYWECGAAKGALPGREGRPLSARQFIPSAALLGAPILLLLSRKFKPARWALRALGGMYVSRGFKAAKSVADAHGANPAMTFTAMAIMHVTYGAGFIKGAVMARLSR